MSNDDPGLAWASGSSRACRLCGDRNMVSVFDLGDQVIGSYFPASDTEFVPSAPLDLVRCPSCGLVQLSEGCDHADVYATGHYGYRSSQNRQMIEHLKAKAEHLTQLAELVPGDIVLDIGGNDGTLLSFFAGAFRRIVVDPTADQFHDSRPEGVGAVAAMFSRDLFVACFGEQRKAKLITSLSMLYDLDDPKAFVAEVAECLADDGLWHFEQCYLPTMLSANSYDTICHEHLTYYTVDTVTKLLASAGMRVLDVDFNDVNGGSFAVTACKVGQYEDRGIVCSDEAASLADIDTFRVRSRQLRDELVNLVHTLNSVGYKVGALGASTKGNTLLQYCGFGPQDLVGIGEINADKIGRVTPGTHIPIVEERFISIDCDYLLVLPWHFRPTITERMHHFLDRGGRLIYPLPELEVVTKVKSMRPAQWRERVLTS